MGLDTPPLLSVIVTCRNAVQWIGDCIKSVSDQSFTDFECLIMDDASDDGTWDAIQSAALGHRFRLFHNDVRRYVPSTTRQLIESARGEVIVWIGGDDLFSGPHALARIVKAYASGPDVDATYGSFLALPHRSRWPLSLHPPGYPWYEGWCFSHILTFRRQLSLASIAEEWQTAAYTDENGEPYQMAGDVAIFYGVVFRARAIAFIPDVLYYYRFHDHNDHVIDRQAQVGVEHRICAYWTERVKARSAAIVSYV